MTQATKSKPHIWKHPCFTAFPVWVCCYMDNDTSKPEGIGPTPIEAYQRWVELQTKA